LGKLVVALGRSVPADKLPILSITLGMTNLLRSAIGLSLLGHVLGEDYETDGFCNFKGILLPLFGAGECEWPNIIRIILYMTGLFWTFLGVGVISDVFMGGIEKVTSQKRRFKDSKTGRWKTHYVWNATVANLTLMALGSSAPEILLSLIEITFDNMFLGDLGAGTIVGSAAFNLLIISGVCICAIPDGEVRKIKQTKVFYVTAFFSVFAYMWLMLILMVFSPNVTDLWEALVTLLFCPLFVFLAFMADKGYFDRGGDDKDEKKTVLCLPDGECTEDELQAVIDDIRERHGQHLTDDQVVTIMEVELKQRKSKAQYQREGAAQMGLTRGKRASVMASHQGGIETMPFTSDSVGEDRPQVRIGFGEDKVIVKEDCGSAELSLLRYGAANVKVFVKFRTVDGSAKSPQDYTEKTETLCFEPNEMEKKIFIDIKDDEGFEESEEFYVEIDKPYCDNLEASSCQASIEGTSKATVLIIDDDMAGRIRFQHELITFKTDEKRIEKIVVSRYDGIRGEIGCSWRTENHTAAAGLDYEKGEGEVKFGNDETKFEIPITLLKRTERPAKQFFNVILTNPSEATGFDPDTDGGAESCILTVELKASHEGETTAIAQMKQKLQSVNNTLGNKNYYEQFHAALFDVGGDEDSDEPPSAMDYVMHVISMPWNLLFACVPPADYCGGWPCFCGSLCCIAIVTALVGDLANLVGCCLGINSKITAITFVALGTSLPDTFASVAAARNDPDADASIGNVTGSNSVNVFMGIGISWLLAACYWQTHDPNDKWYEKLSLLDDGVQDDVISAAGCTGSKALLATAAASGSAAVEAAGFVCKSAVFMTPAGSIWFNLGVYVLNALGAIGLLELRRKKHGGELGGPKKGWLGQHQSGTFMVTQWFIYIIASSIYATVNSEEKKNWDKYFV
jgi:solute carrier family 8 (sodium/calcium exchanger)